MPRSPAWQPTPSGRCWHRSTRRRSAMPDIDRLAEGTLPRLAERLALADALAPRAVVSHTADGVAFVAGLDTVAYEELVAFDSGALGMAHDLRADTTGVLLLTGADHVVSGEGVRALGALPTVTVGPSTLGRIIDPLG